MDLNNKPSTSGCIQSDSSDDEIHENLSAEEICLKIKTFRNLCFGNKNSIFENSKDDDNATSFQEVSDYLEASAKVYSNRVDNLTETNSELVEKFKTSNYSKSKAKIDDNDGPKIHKSKRQKIMLTTSDKLRRRPNENESSINPALINHKVSSFNCNELFNTSRPSCHLNSLYFDKPLTEEMKICNDEQKECDETITVDKSFFQMMDNISLGAICPEFKGFVAERDKVEDSDNHQLVGIEYRFNPNDYQNNCEDSVSNEPAKLDSDTGDKYTVFNGLVDRDNSYFNPRLLANWKVSRNWKIQAMLKALKSCSLAKRKNIIKNSDVNIVECAPPKITQKQNSSTEDKIKINWLKMSEIDEILKPKLQGNQTLSARTLQKWNPLDNISVVQSSFVNVGYKFDNLKSAEIKPDWWQYSEIEEENNHSDSPNTDQISNDSDESIVGTSSEEYDNEQLSNNSEQSMSDESTTSDGEISNDSDESIVGTSSEEYDNEQLSNNSEQSMSDESTTSDGEISNDSDESFVGTSSEEYDNEQLSNNSEQSMSDESTTSDGELDIDDDTFGDIGTDSKIDIGELKKEISDIIDEECVETNDSSEWSSKLSFYNLLLRLQHHECNGLSIPIVFVALLHLTNKRGLKVFQEHCTVNDMTETFIARPIEKK